MLLAKTVRSSTLRLALLSIAIFGTVVFALLGYVYEGTASYVRDERDRAIAADYAALEKIYKSSGRDALMAAMEHRTAEAPSGNVYFLADSSYARVAGNLAEWPPALRGLPTGWGDFRSDGPQADAAQPTLRATYGELPGGYRLLAAQDIANLQAFTKTIRTAVLIGLALIIVLAAVSSVSVTQRTVGRIEAINATSRAIMQSGLGQRIPLRGTHDEWDQLAENLNRMLDRIEALMGEVRQVTDNVAHDLRTPLARMRGRLERARQRKDYDESLIADMLADLDSVLRMFASLMRISQIEAIDRTAGFRTVDLTEIAGEVVELFDAAAEDRGGHVVLHADGPVRIRGDRDLLFDAMSNLVDNAIKHGREGGLITVEAAESDGSAVIVVADDGPGIPSEQRENVFRRFYRLERSRSTSGNGLGLSLVAAVARLHDARIDMEDGEPGLRVRVKFPGLTASDHREARGKS